MVVWLYGGVVSCVYVQEVPNAFIEQPERLHQLLRKLVALPNVEVPVVFIVTGDSSAGAASYAQRQS